MSFLRYGEIYPCDEGAISRPRPRSSPWMSLQLAIPGRLLSSRARELARRSPCTSGRSHSFEDCRPRREKQLSASM